MRGREGEGEGEREELENIRVEGAVRSMDHVTTEFESVSY